jgi:hypothetical protein
MYVKATLSGDLGKMLDREVRDVAAKIRRGVERAAIEVQSELRADARGTGFKDGGRSLANAWRIRVYPTGGGDPRTLKPAALIYSRMPEIAKAHDTGASITHKGQGWLCFPTGYNATAGRRNAGSRGGLRVTPDQMKQAKGEAFVIRSKTSPNVHLWCLRVRSASGIKSKTGRGGGRLKLYVAGAAEVMTGHFKGRAARLREVQKAGFVPMFFLMKQVKLKKKTHIDDIRKNASGVLASWLSHELRQS